MTHAILSIYAESLPEQLAIAANADALGGNLYFLFTQFDTLATARRPCYDATNYGVLSMLAKSMSALAQASVRRASGETHRYSSCSTSAHCSFGISSLGARLSPHGYRLSAVTHGQQINSEPVSGSLLGSSPICSGAKPLADTLLRRGFRNRIKSQQPSLVSKCLCARGWVFAVQLQAICSGARPPLDVSRGAFGLDP